jgi:hypothetical protein
VRVEEGLTNRLLGLGDGTVTFPPREDYALVLEDGWQMPIEAKSSRNSLKSPTQQGVGPE